MKKIFDWNEYKAMARRAAAEGLVLLRNENDTLPIRKGERVSVFGRIQLDYYSTGAGSGGMVNTPYQVSVVDGLRACEDISINEELFEIYRTWEETHPFDPGVGWAQEPFYQEEMPLSDEIVDKAASESDIAVVIFGRCAGEDKDARYEKGSYLLTDDEEDILAKVCARFSRTVVLLNVGSIMDMSWVEKYGPQAVMYIWQGGVEGGNGVADVLTGKVTPCGHLSDTIAKRIEDYPSYDCFGDKVENIYKEDIYVGYRYFESVAKDKVLYPFGFGLSYTDFSMEVTDFTLNENEIHFFVNVKNTGSCAGKEVVQVYYEPPMGVLGKPLRNLIRFSKTVLLHPGKSQRLFFKLTIDEMASYDDTGLTGNKSCFVLEAGEYRLYVGNNVRSAEYAGSTNLSELYVVKRLEEALAPTKPFERMVFDGKRMNYEPVLRRQTDIGKRINERRPVVGAYAGDKGYKLVDVANGKIMMEEFLSQLSDDDLIEMLRGEGMCSPKVTAGIAGAIGGVTKELEYFGIPVFGCADGPAGIRMDTGAMAFSIPSGTLLACTFDIELVNRIYVFEGMELRINQIDTLLGPGLNIHRNPLNGRNFEYFSEDPYLTGQMAISELKGMQTMGVTGTCKHFAGNNQETERHSADSVISERALREIYLKAFEMAVRDGGAYCIMSSYGPVNGTWTASNYDLLTTILRGEWGYDGLVMTDWAAKGSDELDPIKADGSRQNVGPMVRAQNDVYMVVGDSKTNSNNDNMREWLDAGKITRGELLRCAANICNVIMRSPVMYKYLGKENEWEEIDRPEKDGETLIVMKPETVDADKECSLSLDGASTDAGTKLQYRLTIKTKGTYQLTFKVRSFLPELSQINLTFSVNNTIKGAFTLFGTGGEWKEITMDTEINVAVENYIDIYFGQSGMELGAITIKKADA